MFRTVFLILAVLASTVPFSASKTVSDAPPDDVFTASVVISGDAGPMQIVPGTIDPDAVAVAQWERNISTTGWSFFRVQTNTSFSASQQYYAAGMLEGYLSYEEMEYYAVNQYSQWGFTPATVPTKIASYIQQNLEYLRNSTVLEAVRKSGEQLKQQKEKQKQHGPGPQNLNIWKEVGNVLQQFDGLVAGYQAGIAASNASSRCLVNCDDPSTAIPSAQGLSVLDMLLLNAAGDMETLVDALSSAEAAVTHRYSRRHRLFEDEPSDAYVTRFADNVAPLRLENAGLRTQNDPTMMDCSAFVRVLDDKSDVFFAHATWRNYMLMNRAYKITEINGLTTAFSSTPGFITSKDDFYITSNNLTVWETTFDIFNASLYSALTPQSLLVWVRTVVANRLATTGAEWTSIFAEYNSGTYNNQFGVLDMNLFDGDRGTASSGLFWIIEQVPGFTRSGDVTDVLLKQGYWASYNVPFYEDVFNMAGYPSAEQSNPQTFSYTNCSRALIFGTQLPKVTTFEDAQYLIRYNEYTKDPFSYGDPAKSVASRYDLRTPSVGTASSFGAVDGKITSWSRVQSGNLFAAVVSGPTHASSITPPFSWSNPLFSGISHVGQPTDWNFPWIQVEYSDLLSDDEQ